MTTAVDICNRALLTIGSQRVITSLTQDSLEARACNATYANTRDGLLRMAPWNCAMKTANLVYITSVPGTPENVSPATALWQPGQPRPPWAYEYQYPPDCLKACWIIPAEQTGFTGIPITTAVTGSAPTTWLGGPIRFKVGIDRFFAISATTVLSPGSGYVVGDFFSLETVDNPPNGGPGVFLVENVDGSGGVVSADIVNQIMGIDPAVTGSYFNTSHISGFQGSTTGSGSGVVLNINTVLATDQRVILTNQQNATLVYVRQAPDPNTWDPLFQDAFYNSLAADLCMVLTGDKTRANMCITNANASIREARQSDGNEDLTVNDVTPDWLRVRGVSFIDGLGPYSGFDWGGFMPSY